MRGARWCFWTLGIGLLSAAWAQPEPGPIPTPGQPERRGPPPPLLMMFQRLDRNGDGRIGPEEFPGPPEVFRRLDRDGDGFLTPGEMPGRFPEGLLMERMGGRLWQADRDGDGRISQDEFPGPPEVFQRLDRNRDGFITREEMEVRLPTEPGRETRGRLQEMARALVRTVLEEFARLVDQNRDGQCSQEEWQQAFQALDANKDGLLSVEEMLQGILQVAGPPGPPGGFGRGEGGRALRPEPPPQVPQVAPDAVFPPPPPLPVEAR